MGFLNNYTPDWLPEDPSKNAAARQGLLAFAGAMMNSRGGLLNGVGNGLVAGGTGYNDALAQQGQQAMRDAQLQQTTLENQKLQGQIDEPMQLAAILNGKGPAGATPTIAPRSALPQIGAAPAQSAVPAFNTGYAGAPQSMPTAPQPQQQAPAPAVAPADLYQTYLGYGDRLTQAGKPAAAKQYYDLAEKLKPKYATDFRVAQGDDGKLHNYLVAEDGTFKDVGLGVKPDMVATDTGDKVVWNDRNVLVPGSSLTKGQSPDSKATVAANRYGTDVAARTAGNRLAFDKEQAAAENAPDTTTAEEKKLWLHTYTANNGQMPRSAPPAVRKNIGTWAAEMGITPNDLSSGAAKAKFDQAMAVTAGHRGGAMASVEATMPALVENAQAQSHKLGQGKFVPLNKLLQMSDENISDPALAAFKVAHMAVVSEYQQVISRGGTNVTALNEAMHVLNGARSVEAYDAAMNMVKKEVAINVAGTQAVRAGMGSANHGTPTATIKPVADLPKKPTTGIPAGWSVKEK